MAPPALLVPLLLSMMTADGVRLARLGLLLNIVLAAIKIITGVLGNSYALIADGVESSADVLGSLVVWSGLRIAGRSADDAYPFGYGKAEAVAAAVVGLMLLVAALGIAIESIREILTPHHAPAPFTLIVLVGVVVIKELVFRQVQRAARRTGSTAVYADAWHHRSDAITSLAAFVGISIALLGGPGWESADDWAALLAGIVIVWNGLLILRPAVHELMDRAPPPDLLGEINAAALTVPGVRYTEKLKVRRAGSGLYVDLHVQADPTMSLHDAHELSGKVKSAIRAVRPAVQGVLIHMEPYEVRSKK